ncbi:collagen alpha-1(I) chain-like [Perognathus longimembris pacificus]|uniref:collagen alpha-1(I) chain-like n=1 Tax=Perognathus longimembris pacificus TaxID=214514 RepID=UPI002019E303|nr:collagen alpha-1(I) chain-like [Perognathus longimembris pacificus]
MRPGSASPWIRVLRFPGASLPLPARVRGPQSPRGARGRLGGLGGPGLRRLRGRRQRAPPRPDTERRARRRGARCRAGRGGGTPSGAPGAGEARADSERRGLHGPRAAHGYEGARAAAAGPRGAPRGASRRRTGPPPGRESAPGSGLRPGLGVSRPAGSRPSFRRGPRPPAGRPRGPARPGRPFRPGRPPSATHLAAADGPPELPRRASPGRASPLPPCRGARDGDRRRASGWRGGRSESPAWRQPAGPRPPRTPGAPGPAIADGAASTRAAPTSGDPLGSRPSGVPAPGPSGPAPPAGSPPGPAHLASRRRRGVWGAVGPRPAVLTSPLPTSPPPSPGPDPSRLHAFAGRWARGEGGARRERAGEAGHRARTRAAWHPGAGPLRPLGEDGRRAEILGGGRERRPPGPQDGAGGRRAFPGPPPRRPVPAVTLGVGDPRASAFPSLELGGWAVSAPAASVLPFPDLGARLSPGAGRAPAPEAAGGPAGSAGCDPEGLPPAPGRGAPAGPGVPEPPAPERSLGRGRVSFRGSSSHDRALWPPPVGPPGPHHPASRRPLFLPLRGAPRRPPPRSARAGAPFPEGALRSSPARTRGVSASRPGSLGFDVVSEITKIHFPPKGRGPGPRWGPSPASISRLTPPPRSSLSPLPPPPASSPSPPSPPPPFPSPPPELRLARQGLALSRPRGPQGTRVVELDARPRGEGRPQAGRLPPPRGFGQVRRAHYDDFGSKGTPDAAVILTLQCQDLNCQLGPRQDSLNTPKTLRFIPSPRINK